MYDPNDNLYKGTLKEWPQIREKLADRFYGSQAPETIRLIFGNRSGFWDNIIANHDIRGTDVTIKYYDPANAGDVVGGKAGFIIGLEDGTEFGLEASMVKTLGKAKIQQYDILDEATITVELNSMDPLKTLLPKKVINTTDWPYATDLGEPVQIVVGQNKGVWLPYFHYDYTNDYYDYGPIYGNIQDITAVYRDGKLVNSDDYTVYTGHQDTPHGGYAFIRFDKEQCDSSGSFLRITADVNGYPRDFAFFMRDILEDDTWGLGETVNQNSFDAAKSDLQVIGSMYCDGVIDKQREARDILDELAFCCRGDYSQNAEGEWTLYIDKYSTDVAQTFGYQDGYYNNIHDVLAWGVPSASQAAKSYTLKYGKNKNGVFYENTRSILSFGTDIVDETSFVQDHVTADKITYYQSKLAEYDNDLVILVGMEGEGLSKRQIIAVDIPARNIDENRKIEEIVRGDGEFQIRSRPHNSTIYGYVAGDMPSDSDEDVPNDYRETAPESPVGLSVVALGTKQSEDGTTFAYIELYTQRPNEKPNFSKIIFGYKRTTESNYTLIDGFNSSGLEWRCKIEGLIPGATYDYIAYQTNAHGLLSTASNPTLQQAALGDTTAPSEPTGASVSSPTLVNALIEWTNPSDADYSHTLIYRHTANNFGASSIVHSEKGGPGEAEAWPDTDIEESTTYYYWLVGVDYSGNESDEVAAGNVTISDTFSPTNLDSVTVTATDITGTNITADDFYGENLSLESSVSQEPLLEMKNTNADQYGAIHRFLKESASEADDDVLGITEYKGYNDAATPETIEYIRQQARSADVTDGDEAGEYKIFVMIDGTLRETLTIDGFSGGVNQGKVIINQDLQDVDFVVSSSQLYVDYTLANVTINGAPLSAHYDLLLAGDGVLALKEGSAPVADEDYAKIWATGTNLLNFQDGAGDNHVVLMTDGLDPGTGINITDNGDGTATWAVKAQDTIGDPDIVPDLTGTDTIDQSALETYLGQIRSYITTFIDLMESAEIFI